MNLFKKLCLLIAVLMVVTCLSGCTGNGDTTSNTSAAQSSGGAASEITSSNTENTSSDVDLPVGPDADKTDEEFNQIDSSKPTPIPENMTDAQKEASGLYDKIWVEDLDTDIDEPYVSTDYNYNDSLFNEKDTFRYLFENDWYAYGITVTGSEVIAYKDAEGKYLDVLAGGGVYALKSTLAQNLAVAGTVKSFQRLTLKNYDALLVRYNITGTDAKDAIIETTYIFYEKSIGVQARAALASDSVISSASSAFIRNFKSGYEECVKNMNFDWVFPEDGDQPYRRTESWVTRNKLDDLHTVYTFNRGNIAETVWDYYVRYPEINIPLNFEQGNTIDSLITYDLVLARTQKGEKASDYLAYFEGEHSDFAAGIAPIEQNTANNSIFVGEKVEINLNVTNIADYDVEFSARYDIRDYYGNIVDAGLFINSTVFENQDANRTVTIDSSKTGYGMYYLNFMVVSKYYAYREFYPLVLLDDYTYKYNQTNPFGIVQFIAEDADHPDEVFLGYDNTWDIMNKIGVAVTRNAFANLSDKYLDLSLSYHEKMKQAGMRNYSQAGGNEKHVEILKDYWDIFLYGNEHNLPSINSGTPLKDCMDKYELEYFNVAEKITDKFGVKHYIAGVSAGQTAWYDELYNRGMWDKMEGIALHTYGIPYSPDHPSYIPYTWSMEGGIIRTVNAIKQYGYKPYVIDETGYHSGGTSKGSVTTRLQGDFNMRCLILSVAYGAEYVGLYGALDYSNTGFGTRQDDQECHFGSFYARDYYGRILAKPSAAMFAFLTRELESVKSITESKKYSSFTYSNGTVRAFVADTELYGNVVICWSRKYLPYTDTGGDRDAMMPWQTHWNNGYDETVFEAAANEVIVTDCNGKDTVYTPDANGKVTIPLTGEVYFIKGVKV